MDAERACDVAAGALKAVYLTVRIPAAAEPGVYRGRVAVRWSSRKMHLESYDVKREADGQVKRLSGEEFLPQFLPAFVAHLREKGWLEKTFFHICDEPANHNVLAWREAAEFVRRCAPELRRIDAIEFQG